jgi:hypothetical protein
MARILRRLGRRFQYVHPTKRHIILITLCFWLSGIALWSIRHFDGDTNGDYMEDTDLFWRSKNLNNYDSVVHQRIRKLHESDTVRPKLYPGDNPKWQYYPVTELFAWADIPAHSVRALVNNNKTYHGEMGEAVKVPADLEAEAKARQSIHQLNVVASELVSLNRRLPDVRHERYYNFKDIFIHDLQDEVAAAPMSLALYPAILLRTSSRPAHMASSEFRASIFFPANAAEAASTYRPNSLNKLNRSSLFKYSSLRNCCAAS